MTEREFCFWLHGALALGGLDSLNIERLGMLRRNVESTLGNAPPDKLTKEQQYDAIVRGGLPVPDTEAGR